MSRLLPVGDGGEEVDVEASEEPHHPSGESITGTRQAQRRQKRPGIPSRDERPRKQVRSGIGRPRRQELLAEDLASALRFLDEDFAVKEKLSNEKTWCMPIPHERKVSTVRDFYQAFHDMNTLPIRTCRLCYRKRTRTELVDITWDDLLSSCVPQASRSPFSCRSCFPEGESVLVCGECARCLARGSLSPAGHVHHQLGCEHLFPEELKGLTPVEEKLIAPNSCYGFVASYSIPGGQRQAVMYPRHVKGHITVFPNNVQELATKPAPSDLSSLLSVRRRVVERALVWLKRNNPLYAEIEIDVAEMESWGDPVHGVPALVYERMERNEPSAWAKTRTSHIVPPTERAMDDEGSVEIEEILTALNQGEDSARCEAGRPGVSETHAYQTENGTEPDQSAERINEVASSGMFALDGPPEVTDADKLLFACEAVAKDGENGERGHWGPEPASGPCRAYIHVRRGDEFADTFEASFFAKTFPTLLPFGVGGPRLAEEAALERGRGAADTRGAEAATRDLLSSRNMSLRTWAGIVLQRHGGRFATHHIFAFLAFNMGVRSRNRRVSMLSVTRKNFRKAERIVRSLTVDRLATARTELERSGKTTDEGVKELLRSLSLYGYRQPMSREHRLSMRHKIQALIVRYGVPAIWFTINPNDITNPVKLRLAAHRTRDPEAAEEFLRSLETSFKRTRLSISDPMSSAYSSTGRWRCSSSITGESVFGRISQYYGAVETNERGALHVHGLLWLHGNAHMSSMLADIDGEDEEAYRERIVQYIDSIFCEVALLAFSVGRTVQAERSVTEDISSLVDNAEQFAAAFDEEANFCAGATQIHTHSPTTHPMVNRWNKAIAVGLRHNHDISFIATQRKTMALIYYVTNYATKVEDPTWKRVAAAAELLPAAGGRRAVAGEDGGDADVGDNGGAVENKTRQFLMRVANRIFTERPLSQVEVVAHLLGYPSEFTTRAWAYLNVSVLYWHVFRRWRHLRQTSGAADTDSPVDESIVVEESGQRIGFAEAYHHRGHALRDLCLYDYVSLVRLQRVGKEGSSGGWGEVPFESGWSPGKDWVQLLRRPGKHAVVCLDGYLSKDLTRTTRRRAIVGTSGDDPDENGCGD
ncbi:hypothetical protein O9K51_09878 [Purpureocillium lavendulum]|uniref:Helitron helicase-like domain-containing protein n=1 Tax=Purpureocillium lavendulum TaxID=1247861 RepID=A0AB34FFR0_9HYPO|nr:hypothetical protein O9K51_09878 [Purpureocillium lavendulum]